MTGDNKGYSVWCQTGEVLSALEVTAGPLCEPPTPEGVRRMMTKDDVKASPGRIADTRQYVGENSLHVRRFVGHVWGVRPDATARKDPASEAAGDDCIQAVESQV